MCNIFSKQDLRSEAESRIYDLLNLKIDELLDLGKYRACICVLKKFILDI